MANKKKKLLYSDNLEAFSQAVAILRRYTTTRFRTNNFAVAIAIFAHGATKRENEASSPSRVFSFPGRGTAVTTSELQRRICDPVWHKRDAFLPDHAEGPIYKPFTSSFKPLSEAGTNNWRNSFDLQAGISCDAPADEFHLYSDNFLRTPRFDCEFRDQITGRCRSPSGLDTARRTCFNPSKRGIPPGADTTASMAPKLLSRGRDAEGREGYFQLPISVGSLIYLLADPFERVPALPFAMAMYGGSVYFDQWDTVVSVDRLQADLGLNDEEYSTLFDTHTDPERPSTKDVKTGKSAASIAVRDTDPKPANDRTSNWSTTREFDANATVANYKATAGQPADPADRLRLLEKATQGHNRALRTLGCHLQAKGCDALTEQLGGYDLLASKLGKTHLFEVKTWTPSNLRTQVRHAVSQLYEYKYVNELPGDTKLYLVLDRKPPKSAPEWLWKYLYDDRRIVPCWLEGGELLTFETINRELGWISA